MGHFSTGGQKNWKTKNFIFLPEMPKVHWGYYFGKFCGKNIDFPSLGHDSREQICILAMRSFFKVGIFMTSYLQNSKANDYKFLKAINQICFYVFVQFHLNQSRSGNPGRASTTEVY